MDLAVSVAHQFVLQIFRLHSYQRILFFIYIDKL